MLSLSLTPTNCTPIYRYTGFNPSLPTYPHQCSYCARITKPAKISTNQIRFSSQNTDTESFKTQFNKDKDARTPLFSSVPIQPLSVLTKVTQNAVAEPRGCPHWEGRFATAHLAAGAKALPTLLSNTFFLFLAYPSPTFPCLPKQN